MTVRPLIILVLLALPVTLGAQDARNARLDGKLDGETQAVVLRTLDSAKMRGLPVDPLVDKAYAR